MARDKFLRQLTPCCDLPYEVMVFFIKNSIVNEDAQNLIISFLDQRGRLTKREWLIYLNYISIVDNVILIDDLKEILQCGSFCEFMKLFINNVFLNNWEPEADVVAPAPESGTDLFL